MSAPAVWIGCITCRNEGYLVGAWYDAIDGAAVTPEDLHGGPTTHEELEIADYQGLPIDGEPSISEATAWGELYAEWDNPELWPAVCSWVRSGAYTAEGSSDLPALDDFTEAFCGQWPTFLDFALELADDIGLLQDVPDELRGYFSMHSWAKDLSADYSVLDAPDYSVYVFHNT